MKKAMIGLCLLALLAFESAISDINIDSQAIPSSSRANAGTSGSNSELNRAEKKENKIKAHNKRIDSTTTGGDIEVKNPTSSFKKACKKRGGLYKQDNGVNRCLSKVGGGEIKINIESKM